MSTLSARPSYRLLSAPEAKSEARRPGGVIQCVRKELVGAVVRAVDDTEASPKRLSFTLSTASVDRDNDSISQAGWRLDSYLKNPVMLWGHDYSMLPVGKANGLVLDGGNLRASDVEFVERDISEFAWVVEQMYRKGFLNAVSVGFRPLEYKWNDERGGMACDYVTQELLEFSAVPVPANPEALVGAKAAGIPLAPMAQWAERILQDAEAAKEAPVSRDYAEKLYRVSSAKTVHQVPAALVVPEVAPAAAEEAPEEDGADLVDALDDVRDELADLKKTIKVLTRTMKAMLEVAVKSAVPGVTSASEVRASAVPLPVQVVPSPAVAAAKRQQDIGKATADEVRRQMTELLGLL